MKIKELRPGKSFKIKIDDLGAVYFVGSKVGRTILIYQDGALVKGVKVSNRIGANIVFPENTEVKPINCAG